MKKNDFETQLILFIVKTVFYIGLGFYFFTFIFNQLVSAPDDILVFIGFGLLITYIVLGFLLYWGTVKKVWTWISDKVVSMWI